MCLQKRCCLRALPRNSYKLKEKDLNCIEERVVGSKSIRDTINKRKFPTFANKTKVVTVKI